MPRLVRRSRPAMASLFEVFLVGEDPEHLDAVASAALDEVSRVEHLLNRHDPAAELARVNREAARRPVLVDVELFAVLNSCRDWCDRTGGAFDPCTPTGRFAESVRLDEQRRTVAFLDTSTQIDLGGFGKGYAIDRAAALIASFGVSSFLLHGGTSSAIARGSGPDGPPWSVALRDPFDDSGTVDRIGLTDAALSCSAVFGAGADRSDLIDPGTGKALDRPTACAVIAPGATEAEVVSTALLVMGRERTERFLENEGFLANSSQIAWIERINGSTTIDWWPPAPEPIA